MSKLTKAQQQVVAKFPIGTRVRLTKDAARMFPTLNWDGTVVSHSREANPKVRWDNRKTISAWAPELLLRVGWSSEKPQ